LIQCRKLPALSAPGVGHQTLLEEEIAPNSGRPAAWQDWPAQEIAGRSREIPGSAVGRRSLLDELLPEAFAVVREAGKRVLGIGATRRAC